MPKLPRKRRREQQLPPPVEGKAPEIFTEPVTFQERLMIRCPCCGRVGEPSYTSKTGVTVGISDGPYELAVFVQRFGGSMPSPTGRMGDRPGFMEYTQLPEKEEEWRQTVKEKLQEALGHLGGD